MSAENLQPAERIARPTFSYDDDLDASGRQACDQVFGLITQKPDLVLATLGPSYRTSSDVIKAAALLQPTQSKVPGDVQLLRDLGVVFTNEYDYSVGYDSDTEAVTNIQRERVRGRRDERELTRLNRIRTFAARTAIFHAQQAENESAPETR
jgi:hypothetical protein